MHTTLTTSASMLATTWLVGLSPLLWDLTTFLSYLALHINLLWEVTF